MAYDINTGAWSMYFDGSDVGLGASSEDDVNGAWVDDSNGDIYLTTRGDPFDIFVCTPGSVGPNTSCTYQFFWNPQANNGLTAVGKLDGISQRGKHTRSLEAILASTGSPTFRP